MQAMSSAERSPSTEGASEARNLRRQRRRVIVVMAAALTVIVLAAAVVIDQTWVDGPDLSVGSRHHVTVEVEHPCGPGSVVLRQVQYGGHVWWVDGSPRVPLGQGTGATLVITRPVTSGPAGVSTESLDTADLDVGGHLVPLEGGGQSGPLFSCPIQ